MKLLIITQVIDSEHPILGFFHRWVEEFAKHTQHIHVIALQVGKYDLPKNVTVHSLGKDEGKGRLVYLWRFYTLSWQLRKEYDNVFIHMNQMYVILGALLWRAYNKKVGLWYAHGAVSVSLTVAVRLAHLIFTSTEQGMRINTNKRKIVGQGIDTDMFKSVATHSGKPLRLVTVGRVSQSKNIATLLKACAVLKEQGIDFNFRIIGPSLTSTEVTYAKSMHALASELGVADSVTWVGSLPQTKLPTELQSADIFIHDGSTNSLDKALLEASLCGCIVISSNPSYQELTSHIAPSFLYPPHDAESLAKIVRKVISNTSEANKRAAEVAQSIYKKYSISQLISGIVSKY